MQGLNGAGLNGPGLNQWLQNLRHRGLAYLPQRHQLSLGLNRSRIPLRLSQHPIPGGVPQLLLQFRLVAFPQRQLQTLQHFYQAALITAE